MTLVQLVRSSIRLILQKPYVYETCTTNELSEMEDLNDGSKRKNKKKKTVAFDIEIKTDSEKRLMGYAAAVSQSCK